MEEKLIDTGEKITQAQEDLEEAEAKAEQQYADMKIRIKYMYEDGQSDAWEALLTATDFTRLYQQGGVCEQRPCL